MSIERRTGIIKKNNNNSNQEKKKNNRNENNINSNFSKSSNKQNFNRRDNVCIPFYCIPVIGTETATKSPTKIKEGNKPTQIPIEQDPEVYKCITKRKKK